METRPVVILRRFIELHETIIPGTHPFSGINRTGNQCFVDLATRQRDRRGTHFCQYVTAHPRDTHLESLEVICRIDLLAKPTPHLYPVVTRLEALDIERGTELIPQFLTTTPIDPGVDFVNSQPKRHRPKKRIAFVLAFPVIVCRMVGLCVARGDFIKSIECFDPLVGCKVLHMNPATTHYLQVLSEALCTRTEAWKIPTPCADHHHFNALLGDGRCGQRCRSRRGPCRTGSFQKISTFHVSSSSCS